MRLRYKIGDITFYNGQNNFRIFKTVTEYIFKLYITQSLKSAVDIYVDRMGITPTIALIRPDFELTDTKKCNVKIFPSRFGVSSGILLSHQVDENELVRREMIVPGTKSIIEVVPTSSKPRLRPKKKRRPRKVNAARCPHCEQIIKQFENLGWWWGWSHGIEPSYWQQLREYVFDRDEYKCVRCGERKEHLVAHHIMPKEDGGTDGARNLETRCNDCHLDTRPIYDDSKRD